VPLSERPSVTVTAFEYGTVASQLTDDDPARGRLERVGVRDTYAFAEALGTGAAALLVEKLVESDRFKVFERSQLEAVRREQQIDGDGADRIARARYVITGSISRLGMNEKDVGGVASGIASAMLLGRLGHLGHLGLIDAKQSSTTVHLTARVVDTRTGEIVGSFTEAGVSNKRWGVHLLGMGPGGLGGVRAVDSNFRETAVGEATARAAAAIAERVIALRATRLGP